jgi:hypothetical protein
VKAGAAHGLRRQPLRHAESRGAELGMSRAYSCVSFQNRKPFLPRLASITNGSGQQCCFA